jgi:hypothetical protein
MEFIFMLTHHDRTVADAMAVYRELAGTDLKFVGFKDVGASPDTLRALTDSIHADRRSVFLEVVSTSRDDELRSIEAAIEAGVDYVLGGTHVDDVLPMLAGQSARYFPFPGTVVGHPSVLEGSIARIADHAAELTKREGVHGLDLLAYRHRDEDPAALARAVVQSAAGPVIAAGNVDREDRIHAMAKAGVWAFTIGSAIFEGRLPGGPSMPAQVDWVLATAGR